MHKCITWITIFLTLSLHRWRISNVKAGCQSLWYIFIRCNGGCLRKNQSFKSDESHANNFSVSPDLSKGFARGLALVAFLRNIALLSINMKAIWRASFLRSREQADQCNNSGETEEVYKVTFLAKFCQVAVASLCIWSGMVTEKDRCGSFCCRTLIV